MKIKEAQGKEQPKRLSKAHASRQKIINTQGWFPPCPRSRVYAIKMVAMMTMKRRQGFKPDRVKIEEAKREE